MPKRILSAAAAGQWAAALILPAYYLADASITLVRRVLRGEKFWHGHREHFYQQAVRRGFSHATVSTMVAGGNALLILLAMLASKGTSVLRSTYVIHRGYEDLAERLNELGANIETFRDI